MSMLISDDAMHATVAENAAIAAMLLRAYTLQIGQVGS